MIAALVLAADVFTSTHIAATAAITAALALAASLAVTRQRAAVPESLVIALISGVAVFLWRRSANLPQLNSDGLSGFSANDWLAPVIVFVALAVEKALWRTGSDRRLDQARALAVIVALAVNVVTI